VGARAIVDLANRRYVRHRLSALDDSTLHCFTGGVTYVPIPPGNGPNYAGLLTIDLPPTVRKGEVYTIVARQIGDAFGPRIQPPELIGTDTGPQAIAGQGIRWRKVQGSFQLTIPVRTKEVLLAPEERLLGVLKWIGRSIPDGNRWSPVFERYVGVVADRVRALGGDPDAIKPSPSGGGEPNPSPEHRVSFVGKVSEVTYDRYGDFAGFALDTEDGERHFRSQRHEVEQLVVRVWTEQIRIRVTVEEDNRHRPEKITLLQPPRHRG